MDMHRIRSWFQRVAGNRVLQHAMFWILSFVFLLNFFSSSNRIEKVDLIYAFLFHLSLVAAVYLNIWVLIPNLLKKGRYLYYLVSVLGLIFLAALFNQFTFSRLVDIILPGYYFISFYDLDDIVKFILIYVGLTGLLKMSKGWFLLMEANQRLLRIEKEKTEAELKALRSQVNPHFLFNSLNNIYSLALNQSPRTPEVILRLSDLMRYILYESGTREVNLQRELKYVYDYIELQRLRSDSSAEITCQIEGEAGRLRIAPLLFLPFIENSFKHGIKGETKGGFVHVRIKVQGREVLFSARNNIGKVDQVAPVQDQGIGLQNVRRQLELLYPGQHELEVRSGNGVYSVQLKLTLT